jgi:hypothetical protein
MSRILRNDWVIYVRFPVAKFILYPLGRQTWKVESAPSVEKDNNDVDTLQWTN